MSRLLSRPLLTIISFDVLTYLLTRERCEGRPRQEHELAEISLCSSSEIRAKLVERPSGMKRQTPAGATSGGQRGRGKVVREPETGS